MFHCDIAAQIGLLCIRTITSSSAPIFYQYFDLSCIALSIQHQGAGYRPTKTSNRRRDNFRYFQFWEYSSCEPKHRLRDADLWIFRYDSGQLSCSGRFADSFSLDEVSVLAGGAAVPG